MSCLSANITRKGNPISLRITNTSEMVLASITSAWHVITATFSVVCSLPLANVTRMGSPISSKVTSAYENLFASVTKKENGISVNLSMVCSLSKVAEYLRVSPSDIQWITDDIGVFFDVESNTKWIVTTD